MLTFYRIPSDLLHIVSSTLQKRPLLIAKEESLRDITVINSAITTLTITWIFLALMPVNDVIQDIKGEEWVPPFYLCFYARES